MGHEIRIVKRNRHAVEGRRLLVRLLLAFNSESMWLILKTLRHFGQHISFVSMFGLIRIFCNRFQSQQFKFLTVKCPGVLSACNISSLLLLQENISCRGRKISVDLTSSVIVRCGSFCTAM